MSTQKTSIQDREGLVDSFAWVNVSYFYTIKSGGLGKKVEKSAVTDSTGLVTKGQMVAVMGPSGAGKSSLFDVLARRASSSGRLEGSFYVNGRVMSNKDFKSISEYVQHEDVFIPTQTMENALMYHTNLRLGPSVSKKDKRERVMELAKEAGLSDKLKTRIGGLLPGGITVKGLSSGEKRRLSVVCAAIANPSILFLDEPTSGLDSFAAFKVMEMMAKFCRGRRVVICTVHQPRPQIFDLFHKILILSQGRQVYFGDTTGVGAWFDEKLQRPLPPKTSLPDHIIDVVNISFEGLDTKKKNGTDPSPRDMEMDGSASLYLGTKEPFNVVVAAQTYKRDQLHQDTMSAIDRFRAEGSKAPPLVVRDKRASSWLYKFRVVFGRNAASYIKNPGNVLARFISMVVIGVIQGVIFYRTMDKPNQFVAIIALLICLFTTQLESILLPFVSIPVFLDDRKFFIKESESALYPTSVYFLANAFLELLLTTINATVYSGITYYLSLYVAEGEYGFTYIRFLRYLGAVLGVAYSGTLQAITSAILSPSQDIATAITISLTCVFAFGAVPSQLLSFARVIQFVSPLKYGYTAMANNFFAGTSGEDFCRQMGIDDESFLFDMFCMGAFFLGFNIVSFCGLKYMYRKKF